MSAYIVFGISFAFAAAVQPGPFQVFLISQTLTRGWKSTLPAVFAPLFSDIPIIIFSLILLNQLDERYLVILRLVGGLFLLYLAYRTYISWINFNNSAVDAHHSGHTTLLKAALVNVLNPNPYLGWSLIMGPFFLKGWRETPAHGISLLISFYMTMIIFLTIFIFVFAFARNLGPMITRVCLGLSSLALLGFGVYQLILGCKIFYALYAA